MKKLLSKLFLCLLGITVSLCLDDDKVANELIDSAIPQHLRLKIQKTHAYLCQLDTPKCRRVV